MSLLLNGAKTITIAGTEMSCVEIYTGEAYTFPFEFTDSVGAPINTTGWTLGTGVKYYVADTIAYNTANPSSNVIGNLTQSGLTYTGGNLTAVFTTPSIGVGYLYVPANLTGPTGGGPTITLANSSANTNIAIITMTVTRTDALSGLASISKEPIGMIVRFQ